MRDDDRFDDLDDFDGTCPECGATMQRVDSGYDDEYDCDYDRYVCMEEGCDGDIHVEPESEKIGVDHTMRQLSLFDLPNLEVGRQ